MTVTTLKATPGQMRTPSHTPKVAIATLVWLWASVGLVFQVPPIGIVLAIAIVPVLNALHMGRAPSRAVVIACLATMLCVMIHATGPGDSPLTAILVIGLVNLGALFGSASAERLSAATVQEPLPSGWTIEVKIESAADY